MNLIIAPTKASADLVARAKGLRRSEYRYVTSLRDVLGYRCQVYLYLGPPGWSAGQREALFYIERTSGFNVTGVREDEL